MAKIKDAGPKNSSGGYVRLVGDKEAADIFTKAQSTVISNGNELEKIITERTIKKIDDLETFLEDEKEKEGNFLCTKKVLKKSKYKMEKDEPDFLIFVFQKGKECYVIELKDGDMFDTKKSRSEQESLSLFAEHLRSLISFPVKYFLCCFNQEDKDAILKGLKSKFKKEELMTGREFCTLLNIDYDKIIEDRKQDTDDNLEYVTEKFSEIERVKEKVYKKGKEKVLESEFYDD